MKDLVHAGRRRLHPSRRVTMRRPSASRLSRWGSGVAESAHSVWLAGLGALAAARDEGDRLFRRLVERGRVVEDKGLSELGRLSGQAGDVVDGLRGRLSRSAGTTARRLRGPAKRLEKKAL